VEATSHYKMAVRVGGLDAAPLQPAHRGVAGHLKKGQPPYTTAGGKWQQVTLDSKRVDEHKKTFTPATVATSLHMNEIFVSTRSIFRTNKWPFIFCILVVNIQNN
jgi:hypothetical protein